MRIILLILLFVSMSSSAQDIGGKYVSTTGDDGTGDGTYGNPWGTFQKGFDEANRGDTIYFRGGTYSSSDPVILDPQGVQGPVHGESGNSDSTINFWAYPGEVPILDCEDHCTGYDGYNQGIAIYRAEFIHLKGLTVRNVFMCDSSKVSGAISLSETANITIEGCVIHQIGQRGIWVNPGAWNYYDEDDGGNPVPDSIFPYDSSYFINCDIYALCDTFTNTPGNAADGIKGHTYEGNYYEFTGIRVWDFSDNAIDISGQGKRVVDQCWEMPLDNYADIADVTAGKGGIKFGAVNPEYVQDDSTINFMTVYRCLSIGGNFLDLDYSPYRTTNALWYNNTAYTEKSGFSNNQVTDQNETSIYRNNVVYGTTVQHAGGGPYFVAIRDKKDSVYTESHNTWDLDSTAYPWFVVTDTVTVTDADFVTVDSTTIANNFKASRGSNYALPTYPLPLSPTSDLIDVGVDVGIAYYGSAPDIGSYEYDPGGSENPTIRYSISGGGNVYRSNGKTVIIRQ